jgi:hypothetical protein
MPSYRVQVKDLPPLPYEIQAVEGMDAATVQMKVLMVRFEFTSTDFFGRDPITAHNKKYTLPNDTWIRIWVNL